MFLKTFKLVTFNFFVKTFSFFSKTQFFNCFHFFFYINLSLGPLSYGALVDPEIHLFHNETLLPQVMLSNVLSSSSEKNNPGEWHYLETERSQRIKPRAGVGVGGLIRSQGGHWISSFFGHLGSMVILHA